MTAQSPAQGNRGWAHWPKAIALAHAAPRCHARCKHSKLPCRNPAVKGRAVCRMHGGKAGAPRGERNGAYRHGRHTIEARGLKRQARAEYQELRALLKALDEQNF
jgi:hypothetical protein